MITQEAQAIYNKGLDDAENAIYENFTSWLNNQPTRVLANPKLEDLRKRIVTRFEELSSVTTTISKVEAPQMEIYYPANYSDIEEALRAILVGDDYDPKMMPISTIDMLNVVRIRSDHYTSLAGGKTRVGKEFKKLVNEQLTLLTSSNSVVN